MNYANENIKRTYRKLTFSDLDMVARMETDFGSDFICRENAKGFLEDPKNWLFVCIEGGRAVGFAFGYELKRIRKNGNMFYILE